MKIDRTRIANSFLLFQCLTELQITTYQDCKQLTRFYKPSLATKLKNLQTEFEREAKEFHKMFPCEDEYIRYMRCVSLIEKILEQAGNFEKFNSAIELLDLLYSDQLKFASQEELNNPGQ